MAGSGSVVGGAEDLEFNTYMTVKGLLAHDLGNWNEFLAQNQESQKDKNLCERMSYKIISAPQFGEVTWKLLSSGGKQNKTLLPPLVSRTEVF